jgi:hypothetical protein
MPMPWHRRQEIRLLLGLTKDTVDVALAKEMLDEIENLTAELLERHEVMKEQQAALAQVAAERDAARREVMLLRAYALALRGDLIEIDGACSANDWDRVQIAVGRHMRGTFNEDVAALASEELG